jgi:hypothetical protein
MFIFGEKFNVKRPELETVDKKEELTNSHKKRRFDHSEQDQQFGRFNPSNPNQEDQQQQQQLGGFKLGKPRPGVAKRRRMLKRRGFVSSAFVGTRKSTPSSSYYGPKPGSQFFSNIPGFFDNLSLSSTKSSTSASTQHGNQFGTSFFAQSNQPKVTQQSTWNDGNDNRFQNDWNISSTTDATSSGSNNRMHTFTRDVWDKKHLDANQNNSSSSTDWKLAQSREGIVSSQEVPTVTSPVHHENKDDFILETINVSDMKEHIPRTSSPNGVPWIKHYLERLHDAPNHPLWMQHL